MPRQDVPYGGAICRLKERIAEIWDELGKKLHSINGVEGDGQGDVKLVSGDPAVVITDDQVQHEIEISLDTSQLPAAAVSSVNGQTGAVALTADDIPSDNGDVQTDLDNLASANTALQGNINAEALARQNADSTLQGNINTLSASIPTAAATAVANDPTVAQLATDVPNKVDKITSGSSLKAYTHTGATQGETSVVDGTTANSIGIRDTNGRMQAADPASGATDKTLVTANWVSQTGAGKPNNVLHDSGDEDVDGVKNYLTAAPKHAFNGNLSSGTGWFKIMQTETSLQTTRRVSIIVIIERDAGRYAKLLLQRRGAGQNNVTALINTFQSNTIIVTRDANGQMIVWTSYNRTTVYVEADLTANQKKETARCEPIDSSTANTEPVAADYNYLVKI